MNKLKPFNKKDKKWEEVTFYKIYTENNEKMFKLIFETNRDTIEDHAYLDWTITIYNEKAVKKLEDMFEWDYFYQYEKIRNNIISEMCYEPQYVFDYVNNFIIDNNIEVLNIKDLEKTINTVKDGVYASFY